VLAVREQYGASERAARVEARHVAEPIAHTIANTAGLTGGDQRQLYHDQQRLQQYVNDLRDWCVASRPAGHRLGRGRD
jgi:methyl coenzyme M reductase alpha subunit